MFAHRITILRFHVGSIFGECLNGQEAGEGRWRRMRRSDVRDFLQAVKLAKTHVAHFFVTFLSFLRFAHTFVTLLKNKTHNFEFRALETALETDILQKPR